MKKWTHYLFIALFSVLLGMPTVVVAKHKMVIAIDPGHGGKDPGAIGKSSRVKEKHITLAISKQLKRLLDADANFKAVLTRRSDYYIGVNKRSEVARKHKANLLVSIHADVSPVSKSVRGASVWVLSNRRANNEMGKWLEDHEKQSELLGGIGSVLSGNKERYLDTTVLDLQFSHAQRAGYDLGKNVLKELKKVVPLVRRTPQHASLAVLRSPDIPSILVETGFLSNPKEERNLSHGAYQKKIARAIYTGLVNYCRTNYVKEPTAKKTEKKKTSQTKRKVAHKTRSRLKNKIVSKTKAKPTIKIVKIHRETKKKVVRSIKSYVVKKDDTLYSLARKYGTTPAKLSKLNNIKNNRIFVGQKLRLK
ncbi:N-acetylmuramoyl-L-alanine amidase [Phocoenobacter skyensis]